MTPLTLLLGGLALLAACGWAVAAYELRTVRESRDRWRRVAQGEERRHQPGSWERTGAGKAKRSSDWGVN